MNRHLTEGVKTITSKWGESNETSYKNALAAGDSEIEAAKKTPSYKTLGPDFELDGPPTYW